MRAAPPQFVVCHLHTTPPSRFPSAPPPPRRGEGSRRVGGSCVGLIATIKSSLNAPTHDSRVHWNGLPRAAATQLPVDCGEYAGTDCQRGFLESDVREPIERTREMPIRVDSCRTRRVPHERTRPFKSASNQRLCDPPRVRLAETLRVQKSPKFRPLTMWRHTEQSVPP